MNFIGDAEKDIEDLFSGGSFFSTAANNSQSLLSPPYSYADNIKSPGEIGMSSSGDTGTLGNDVNGMLSYVSLLVDGSGEASATGGPLGNKYVMNTGASCTDIRTNTIQNRSIYRDNVPTTGPGSLPPGLVIGVVEDVGVFNPFRIFGAFAEGPDPSCQLLTLQTIDNNNNSGSEQAYIALADIPYIPSYDIISKEGFIGNMSEDGGEKKQKEKKKNKKEEIDEKITADLSADLGIQIYYIALSILVIYIIRCIILHR